MSTMSDEEIRAVIREAERRAAEVGPGCPVLVGVAEIAVDQDVARQTVSMWAARRASNGFPEALSLLSMGPVYNLEDVRRWRRGAKAVA